MKNKISAIFWGLLSIPSLLLIINMFVDLPTNLLTFILMWFLVQCLLIPIFLLIKTFIKRG